MWFKALLAACLCLLAAQSNPAPPTLEKDDSGGSPVIVIGFLGGFVRHDDPIRSEVQLAGRLRKGLGAESVVETF